MDIKKYNLPLTCITVTGSKARVTPGLLAKFSGELARKSINIEAVSSGEYGVGFYLDAGLGADAMKALGKLVEKKSAFDALAMRKNIGMISATGSEFINTPGMLARLVAPLSENMINILAVSTGFDSVLLFIDMQELERAFNVLSASFEIERPAARAKAKPAAAQKKAEKRAANPALKKSAKPPKKKAKPAKKARKRR